MISLLFLLSEELHRQPRAVYKYWVPCRLCWEDTCAVGWFLSTAPRIWQSPVRCFVRRWIHATSVYSGFCGTVALGDDFLELFVFSAMLGATVALGDDFLELFVFSAMLGSTVAPGDDFVEMVVFSALLGSSLDTWCCQSSWPFHRCQLLGKAVLP